MSVVPETCEFDGFGFPPKPKRKKKHVTSNRDHKYDCDRRNQPKKQTPIESIFCIILLFSATIQSNVCFCSNLLFLSQLRVFVLNLLFPLSHTYVVSFSPPLINCNSNDHTAGVQFSQLTLNCHHDLMLLFTTHAGDASTMACNGQKEI